MFLPKRDGSSAKLRYANQHITRCTTCQTTENELLTGTICGVSKLSTVDEVVRELEEHDVHPEVKVYRGSRMPKRPRRFRMLLGRR